MIHFQLSQFQRLSSASLSSSSSLDSSLITAFSIVTNSYAPV